MTRSIVIGLLTAIVLCLPAGAGIVLRSRGIQELSVGDVELDGRYYVSAPTIKSSDGKYLSYDANGKSPEVIFANVNGPHATWSFSDLKRYSKHIALATEEKGYTFTARATKGPYKGWYLGRSKEGKLILTKDVAGAGKVKIRVEEVVYKN